MWSFDDEENKQGNDNTEEPTEKPQEEPHDDFSERDPFSRGGDFYRSYGAGSSPSPEHNGKPPKPKKSGILPAILVCAVIFFLTVATVYMLGDQFSFAGIGVKRTSGSAVSTTAPEGITSTSSTVTTSGTTATAPSLTAGTTGSVTTPMSPSYVYWDPAVVEKCLNASVLVSVENVGSGSGVIYTADGYIITNYHVVSNNDNKITVTLFSGEKLAAQYIYGDESNDIAVIKIEKSDCTYVTVSTSEVTYMMPVMVIGNALGKGFNTTQGVVSAPASEVYFSSTYETMTLIRVDAAVNSGNSGGGLFNTAGELVGIVNSKLSGTSNSGASIESMGYAIPVSTVMKCVNDLNEYGYVTGVARLGVTVNNRLQIGNMVANFIVVDGTVAGGSAEKSGIKAKDIIYKINGQEVTSYATLRKMLTAYSVGDKIELTVKRPTQEALEETRNIYRYWELCQDIKITLTFVEFDPHTK